LPENTGAVPVRRSSPLARALPWIITLACFAFLYTRIDGAARRAGSTAIPYLLAVFERVDWWSWLALMIPYSLFFFLVDSAVVWRVVNWFNARVGYADILPVRASTYILSILNEQIGKGVMAYYLNRRDGVPGWQVGSSMLFIMFCEFYYLLTWACVGAALRWDRIPDAFRVLPWLALVALAFFVVWVAYFRGAFAPGSGLRDRQILHAFRQARPWHYLGVIVLRSPALIAAAFVYSRALGLFGVESSFLEMLSLLPLIFFGAATPGPMRAVAITLWVQMFPQHTAEMAVFGLVMHNFFIFFNAAIGLVFLRRANRELMGSAA
jgi:hypothetical protein